MVLIARRRQEPDDEAQLRAEFERLTAATPAMLHSIDENGRLISVSDAWHSKLGYTRDEVLGRLSSDFLTPESRERAVKDILPEFFRNGRCDNVEYQMVCKDGRVIDVLLSAILDMDSTGHGRVSIAVITDVTALKIAERKLAESEAQYRFLADNSADMIILVGRDERRLYVSPACRTILGYEPEEMLEIRASDAVHPDDAATLADVVANGGTLQALVYRMRRKDGSYVWVEAVGGPGSIAGRISHHMVIVRNVDKRVAAEQRLKESETRYRLLADLGTDMVFQLDRTLVRRYVSPACREILGYEPEEMIGIKPISMVHPEDLIRLSLVYQSLLGGCVERQSIINRLRHRDGRWIWVEARLRVLKDDKSGAPVGIIGALRDISARKAIEDELADANRRLQRLAGQDGLTGLANRRAFDQALARECARMRRGQRNLALIMIDVDWFKSFNDRYGHPAGDNCLRWISGAILTAVNRPGDIAARYGGEEFAVLLPDTDEQGAASVAERIRKIVARVAIEHEWAPNRIVTISAGVAALTRSELDGGTESLLLAADRALYCAKDEGRNTVVQAASARSMPQVISAGGACAASLCATPAVSQAPDHAQLN
jgi:diguanylate cyclase (GGDEF)-like protein/PAS domain S-box-containing protein